MIRFHWHKTVGIKDALNVKLEEGFDWKRLGVIVRCQAGSALCRRRINNSSINLGVSYSSTRINTEMNAYRTSMIRNYRYEGKRD